MTDCIFCKIIAGEIPSKKAYEDKQILVFYDIAPAAPVHILLVSKVHIGGADEVTSENSAVVARIFEVAANLACELNLGDGYRLVTNIGKNGRQSVRHLHFHLLGGKKLTETLG